MGQILKHDLLRLDGGLNDGIPSTHIEDNELQSVQNFYPWFRKLIRRPGTVKQTTSAYTYQLTGLMSYKLATGQWMIIAGTTNDLARYDSGLKQMVHIDHAEGTLFTTDTSPWSWAQYKTVGYGARYNCGTIKRTDGYLVDDAGIQGPTTACTGAQGAAGNLEAGDYYYVVTFTAIESGTESDFSPVSAKVTIAASKQIDLTGIPISSDPRVNGRNIYRTFVGQQGEYFFVDQIPNNTETTYSDNTQEVDLGEPVSLDNGLPPFSIFNIALWNERCFATDGRDLFISRYGYPEQFAEDFFIPVFPDDGHELRGLLPYGDRLLLGKTNKVHYLTGTDESDFEVHTLSDIHGVAGGHTMKTFKGSGVWLGLDDFYRTDGSSTEGIGAPWVRTFLDGVTDAEKKICQSWIVPANKWYVTTFPTTGRELVYNYDSGAWSIFKRGSLNAPAYGAETYDANYARTIHCVFTDKHLYQWNAGEDDYGELITAKARSKDFGFDSEALLKVMRNLHLLSNNISGYTLTARLYNDGSSSAVKTRTGISLNGPRNWKNLRLSNLRNAGSTISVELEYSGKTALEISGLSFEVASLDRAQKAI